MEFVGKLPASWREEVKPALKLFAKWENAVFVRNLAITVANSFANLIPEQLQRLGNALVDQACRAAHQGDSWHGVTTREIEDMTGLANMGPDGARGSFFFF